MVEKILSLDVSSKCGFAVLVSEPYKFTLETSGQIPKVEMPTDEEYPGSYVTWAQLIFDEILKLILKFKPTMLVVEETTTSQNSFSQKILEFCHYLLAKYIKENKIKAIYMLTGQWRKLAESKMNDEEKLKNKEVKNYKKKYGTKLAKNKDGKVIGKVTRKHIAVRRANELFGLNLKIGNNDEADAACMAYACHLKLQENKIKDSL